MRHNGPSNADPQSRRWRGLAFSPYIRVILVAVVTGMAFLAIYGGLAHGFHASTQAQREASIRQLVTLGRNAIEPAVVQIRGGVISREEGLRQVRDLVRRMTYEDEQGANYMFMSSYEGIMLVQPYEPDKEMTSQWDLRDSSGIYIIRELVRAAQSKPEGGFVSYRYMPPRQTVAQEKLAFVVGIPELACYIGTGMYVQQSQINQQRVLTRIRYWSLAFMTLLLAQTLISLRAIINENAALGREVTLRSQAEESLASSEASLRTLIDSIHDAIAVHDLDGRIFEVNAPMLRMFGLSREEAKRTPIAALIAEEKSHVLGPIEAAEKATDSGNLLLEWRMRRPTDGSQFDVEVSLAASMWRGGRAIFAVMRDVSQRKAAEEALRESEQRYHQLFDLESDAIFLIDNETGQILEVNQAAETMYGYTRRELQSMRNTDLSAEPEQTTKMTKTGAGWIPLRWHKRKDGVALPVEITARHFSRMGRPVHLAAIRDISERIKAEYERRRLENELQHAQRMESIGRLAGGIAHDFNNLLTPIIVYAGLMMTDLPEASRAHEEAQAIAQAARRARALTMQLLAFSRHQVLELKVVDLRDIVTQFMPLLEGALRESIAINLLRPEHPVFVNADTGQIDQVLMNLAMNAQDAMPDGGSLIISVDTARVDASTIDTEAGDYALLSIKDTGCGMDEATLDRLFEPFFTTKKPGQGTGLGLATSYGIIRQHLGFIKVLSKPASGSIFNVYLPRVEREETVMTNNTPSATDITSHGEYIMVVEDNELVLDPTCRLLERMGYHIIPFSSPAACLASAISKPLNADLLLTDVIMPGMTGAELYRELRQIQPTLRVLFMSGYTGPAIAQHGILEPGTHFIQKPFTFETLGLKVKEALGHE